MSSLNEADVISPEHGDVESLLLMHCWPLDQRGPLPGLLGDRQYIGDAFFQSLPAYRNWPASAVRRGLKQAAKRLGFHFDRSNTAFDQRERDDSLAFQFASLPAGREALRDIEIYLEDTRERHRTRHRVDRIGQSLPQILWTRYLTGSQYSDLAGWTRSKSVDGRDLGRPNAYFLTPTSLDAALREDPPPVALDDPELARVILLFAALLPFDDAVALIDVAYKHGIARLERLKDEPLIEVSHTSEAEHIVQASPRTEVGSASTLPVLPAAPSLVMSIGPLPPPSEAATDLKQAIAAAVVTAREADEEVQAVDSLISKLLSLDDPEYAATRNKIERARAANTRLQACTAKCRGFALESVNRATARAKLELPWLHSEIGEAAPEDLADIVLAADALSTLAEPEIAPRVARLWHPTATTSTDLAELLEAFQQLPSFRSHVAALAARELDYVDAVRAFVGARGTTTAGIADWLRRMSSEEVAVLLKSIDPARWPVVAALLTRLGLDSGGEFAAACEQFLAGIGDSMVRRNLLSLVDPASVAFDASPDLQRMIVAERLRDILSYGPLVVITDPSVRMDDDGLVGAPLTALANLLVQHLDLIGNGTELRRLVSPSWEDCDGADDIAIRLVGYATTTSTSSGVYPLLREAVRERHFAPLVRDGRLDAKLAVALAQSFDVEGAIELAVADVRRNSSRMPRIEPRHRARIQGYVRIGKDLLDTYVRSISPQSRPRLLAFRTELVDALCHLGHEPAPVGSCRWLESEVRAMVLNPIASPEFATLRGEPTPILERAWTPSDTAWAQQSTELPEFYLQGGVGTLDVAAAALRQWALGRDLSPDELADELVARGQFAAAHAYAREAAVTPGQESALLKRVAEEAAEAMTPLKERLANLEAEHGAALIGSLPSTAAVRESLEQFDVREATEQLDFLEMEVAELAEARRRDALEASVAVERAALLRRLLKAGVKGPDERWSFADLEGRWNTELSSRAPERAHLRAVEKALEAGKSLPELAEDARRFSARILEPDCWLPEHRASELTSFVEAPAEKLRTWIQLAGQLDEPQRRALVEVTRWFVHFVEEQSTTLQALEEGASSDTVLERALEVGDAIEQAPDPAACAHSLGLNDDNLPALPPSSPSRARAPEAMNAKLMPLAERAEWRLLAEAACALRLGTGDEDARRLTDIAEFADTLSALADGRLEAAREGIVTAAKVLGASGHVINRALPVSRLLAIAFNICATAVALESKAGPTRASLQTDGSWAPLAGNRQGWQRMLAGNGLATRALEQLCAGSLGREVINKLWEAPTATTEPGTARAALLGFLHERGLNDHLLFLAGRYEPGIRSRLDQLLNLRTIVSQRPDLVPVSEVVASQVAKAAQGVPFRTFVASLRTAARTIDADLVVGVDNDIVLRIEKRKPAALSVTISIEPRGLVPESLEVILFPDDDVSFDDGSRRRRLSDQPMYFASEWTVGVRFGDSWSASGRGKDDNFRIRVNARVLTGDLINRDVVCQVRRADLRAGDARRIDDETLLEAFPGVQNTPARGDAFIGRHEELERLHGALISARRPSPVLLTGIRRIGKTSLLYAFHNRHRRPERDAPVTVYFSLAERRAGMMDPGSQVSAVFYSAIAHALGKRHFASGDLNGELGEKLRQRLGTDRDAVRSAILGLRDPESLADSLTVLSEHLLDWAGGATRVIYLVDEAETLVLPYRGGEAKRLQLEQLLQGLREVSQTSTRVGLLLSGSNHIAEFARSYKNAFFGSSLQIDLAGIKDHDTARKLVSPDRLAPYIGFTGEPVRYAIEMCAGMPQFLWQLGAATSAIVRSGAVTKADVRQGVSALVGERNTDLPFKAYDVLEPIEHMLGLQGQREQDLLWLLLWRVANSSSLIADEAQHNYIIDQSLLELDEFESWKSRLLSLVDLEILAMPRQARYRFRVPIFAEGFRAPRQQHVYHLRQQRAGT